MKTKDKIKLGLSSIGLSILIKEAYDFRKQYINNMRKKKKSWKYYE